MTSLLVFIFVILLVSCNRQDAKTSKQNDKIELSSRDSSKVINIDKFVGKWVYDVWVNDSFYDNKVFILEIKKVSKDSIIGLFSSVWDNGNEIDGWNADTDIDANIFGKIKADSVFVEVNGSYDEDASAKAVICLENDTVLLWKLKSSKGAIFIPEHAKLSKRKE